MRRFLVLGCLALQILSGCGGGGGSARYRAESPPADAANHGWGTNDVTTVVAEEKSVFRGAKKEDSDRRLAMAPPPAPPPPPPGGAKPQGQPPAQPVAAADASRGPMLIYTAQITMAVFEVNASLSKVEAIGRELGGFLAKRDDMSVTIRVPAPVFDEAVKRIETVGDMLHRNVQAEDVTEEFRDLEIRLKSAHAVQARLQELLAKAVKVEESIAIERELDRVTGEIERIEGRMKFLRDRAAYSTITVRFQPKPTEQVGAAKVRLPVPWLYDINLPRLLRL